MADPIGQRRALDLDALARQDRRLSIERQSVQVLRDDDIGEQARTGAALLDRQVGRTVSAIVEKVGLARAEDFTEVVFEGPDEPGQIVSLRILAHDGLKASGVRI